MILISCDKFVKYRYPKKYMNYVYNCFHYQCILTKIENIQLNIC